MSQDPGPAQDQHGSCTDKAPHTLTAHHEPQSSRTEAHPKIKTPVVPEPAGTKPFSGACPSQALSPPTVPGRTPETRLTPAPKASTPQRCQSSEDQTLQGNPIVPAHRERS